MTNSNVPSSSAAGRKNRPIDPDHAPNQTRRLRLEAGLTMDYVADKIECRKSSLQQFETMGRGIGYYKQFRLADVYNTDVGKLLTPGYLFSIKLRKPLDIVR